MRRSSPRRFQGRGICPPPGSIRAGSTTTVWDLSLGPQEWGDAKARADEIHTLLRGSACAPLAVNSSPKHSKGGSVKPVNLAAVAARLFAASLALTGCDRPKQERTAPSPGTQISITQAVQSATSRGHDAEDELPGQMLSRFNDARLYSLGMMLYAGKNQDLCPTNLDQTLPYLREANRPPSGTNHFELLYQGSFGQLTNPTTTSQIILIRSEPWRRKDGEWTRVYGFADGHCEAHPEPDGNFDEWERQHLATSLSGTR